MESLSEIEIKGTEAVRKLRLEKLKNGHPFMINSKELLTNQCYLEYPNGSIKLVTMIKSTREFDVIKELSVGEARSLRLRYKLHI